MKEELSQKGKKGVEAEEQSSKEVCAWEPTLTCPRHCIPIRAGS